jgi:hypothetical protein
MNAPIMMPPWHIKIEEHGLSIHAVDSTWICDVPQKGYGPDAYHDTNARANLIAATPDMWNLVVQLVEAGDKIPDLSPTMKAFIEEARKIKMKVAP